MGVEDGTEGVSRCLPQLDQAQVLGKIHAQLAAVHTDTTNTHIQPMPISAVLLAARAGRRRTAALPLGALREGHLRLRRRLDRAERLHARRLQQPSRAALATAMRYTLAAPLPACMRVVWRSMLVLRALPRARSRLPGTCSHSTGFGSRQPLDLHMRVREL